VLLEALHASPLASPGSDAKSYVFGSVILREGDELVEDSSDVDLLVVLDSTHVSSPHEIVQRVRGLMTAVATTEACLAALLPSRRAGHHRVSSVLVATSDEIDVQAHKSKEPHFFAENVFVALDGDRSAPVPLGIHASSADRVDPARESSAIDCLAGAQSRRHEYLARTDAAGLLRDLTEKEWDPRTDPVPKVLARSAAKLADLVHRESVRSPRTHAARSTRA
jgi:hypothetical protein